MAIDPRIEISPRRVRLRSTQHFAHLRCREYVQKLANLGALLKPCVFGYEKTAHMFHRRSGVIGQRSDRTFPSRGFILVILQD
jgi:hypothetical protein